MHVEQICDVLNCKKQECILRHLKPCKFFFFSGVCRFGENCAYAHEKKEVKEIEILRSKLDEVFNHIVLLERKINHKVALAIKTDMVYLVDDDENLNETILSEEPNEVGGNSFVTPTNSAENDDLELKKVNETTTHEARRDALIKSYPAWSFNTP